MRYSTSFGERESRPFREEPETFISILTSTTSHLCTCSLLLCTQHCRHVHSHWSFRSLQLVEVWPYREEEEIILKSNKKVLT